MAASAAMGSAKSKMQEFGRDIVQRSAAIAALVVATSLLTACGVSSPQTALPAIDHSQPATLLNKKQQELALQNMGKIAEEQKKQAAKITPITYKVPEKSP